MSIKPVDSLTLGGTDWKTSPFRFDVEALNQSGASTRNVIVLGINSVTLTDAVANGLNYVKIYGATEQDIVPTPDNPVDIMTNNGAIQHVIPRTLSGTETLEDSLGNTATAEQLLRIGDSVDEQEILSGETIIRNNVTSFTGEEEWTYQSNYGRVYTTILGLNGGTVTRTKLGFCTHFKWIHNQESMSQINVGDCYSGGGGKVYFHIAQESVDDWKQFLADELANGQPVTIAYPMSFEVPRIAIAQTLTTQAGTNTITIIDSSISDLELKVSYKQSI